MTKLLGNPFTSLPTSNPVGYFFDAFFQASEYYVFVGATQVLAGLLLLFPVTATLGAIVYFPIILNIAIITFAIGFKGTWVITLLMTTACLYLLVWDYDKFKSLLPKRHVRNELFKRKEYVFQFSFWAILGVISYAVAARWGIVGLWNQLGYTGLVLLGAAGGVFGLFLAWHLQKMSLTPYPTHKEVEAGI
ncbi:MAG: hypothetical protein AAF361_14635 [Bacteroidota bacterium]